MYPLLKALITIAALYPLLLPGAAAAQGLDPSPVHWSAVPPSKAVAPGGTLEIKLQASISGAWHIYSATQPPGGPNPTRFSVLPGSPFKMEGDVRQSEPQIEFDASFGILTQFFSGSAEFWIPLRVSPSAKPGGHEIQVQATYQVCDGKMCLPPAKVSVRATIKVAGRSAAAPPSSQAPAEPGFQGR